MNTNFNHVTLLYYIKNIDFQCVVFEFYSICRNSPIILFNLSQFESKFYSICRNSNQFFIQFVAIRDIFLYLIYCFSLCYKTIF